MLLDEPFSALDALTRVSAQALVNELWQRHQPAVLLVTHDVEESLLLADRVLIVDGGRIAYDERFDLERPRRRDHPDLVSRRRELLERLGVDDDRSKERRTVKRLLAALLLAAATATGCGSGTDENLAVAKPASSPEGVKLRVGVQKDGVRSILEKSGQLENVPYDDHVRDVRVRAAAGGGRGGGQDRRRGRRLDAADLRRGRRRGLPRDRDHPVPQPGGRRDPRSQGLGHHLTRAAQGQDDRRRQGQLGARAAAPGPAPHRAEAQRRQAQLPGAGRRPRGVLQRPGRRLVGLAPVHRAGAGRRRRADRRRRRPTSTATRSRSRRRRRSPTPSAPRRSRTTWRA